MKRIVMAAASAALMFGMVNVSSAASVAVRAEIESILDESAADYAGEMSVSDAAEWVRIEQEQLAEVAAAPEAAEAESKGFLKQYRASKKEYRAWKRANREEARAFHASVAQLRKDMRRNSGEFAELASVQANCGESAACAAETIRAVVAERLPKGEKIRTAMCSAVDRDRYPNGHLLIYGKSDCDDGDIEARIRTFGLGLYASDLETNVFFCTGEIRGRTVVGPYAQVAFGYLGTRVGVLFGAPGACVNFNYTYGFGAAAGLQIVTFSK